jgi:hypothetical protein
MFEKQESLLFNKPLEGYSIARIFIIVLFNIFYMSIIYLILLTINGVDDVIYPIIFLVMYPFLNNCILTFGYNIKEIKEKINYYKNNRFIVNNLKLRLQLLYFRARERRQRNNIKIRSKRRHPDQPKADLEYIDSDDARELSAHSSDEEESAVLFTA